jgi:hypothetical protein
MKPVILGSCLYEDPEGLEWLRTMAHQEGKNDIQNTYKLNTFPNRIGATLKELAHSWGYKPRVSRIDGKGAFVPISGSAGWHTDPGLGTLLSWVVWATPAKNPPQLITSHGGLFVDKGDIFVFNANKGHAWISNTCCVMAQIPVSKFYNKAIEVS